MKWPDAVNKVTEGVVGARSLLMHCEPRSPMKSILNAWRSLTASAGRLPKRHELQSLMIRTGGITVVARMNLGPTPRPFYRRSPRPNRHYPNTISPPMAQTSHAALTRLGRHSTKVPTDIPPCFGEPIGPVRICLEGSTATMSVL